MTVNALMNSEIQLGSHWLNNNQITIKTRWGLILPKQKPFSFSKRRWTEVTAIPIFEFGQRLYREPNKKPMKFSQPFMVRFPEMLFWSCDWHVNFPAVFIVLYSVNIGSLRPHFNFVKTPESTFPGASGN